jgi:hypothetical protein
MQSVTCALRIATCLYPARARPDVMKERGLRSSWPPGECLGRSLRTLMESYAGQQSVGIDLHRWRHPGKRRVTQLLARQRAVEAQNRISQPCAGRWPGRGGAKIGGRVALVGARPVGSDWQGPSRSTPDSTCSVVGPVSQPGGGGLHGNRGLVLAARVSAWMHRSDS